MEELNKKQEEVLIWAKEICKDKKLNATVSLSISLVFIYAFNFMETLLENIDKANTQAEKLRQEQDNCQKE